MKATVLVCLFLVAAHLSVAQTPRTADRVDPRPPVQPSAKPPGFVPMTEGERLRQYLKDTFHPISLVSSAAAAGIGQWRDTPPEWKQGGEGFGKRFASSYAEHIVRETMLFGASSVLQEDNRWFPSERQGAGARIGYAVESTFLAHRNDGTRRLSFSHIGSFVGAAFVSRLWQPASSSQPHNAGINLGTSIGVAAGFNVVREFFPALLHGR
ncbi:MAG: hypothetical protein LAP87_18605 [Acidobacteriia bacterium]|nr:hypothetical protein [Terriglobia bacterium]